MHCIAFRCVCLAGLSLAAAESTGQTIVPIESDLTPDQNPLGKVDFIVESIAKLNSDSFVSRQLAQKRLIAHARKSASHLQEVTTILASVDVDPNDLDLFLARERLLEQLDQYSHDIKIDRFLHDPAFPATELTGWKEFRRYAGGDLIARRIYVKILARDPAFGVSLVSQNEMTDSPREQTDRTARTFQVDSIERSDVLSWAMLLAEQCNSKVRGSADASHRLVATLRCFGLGPVPQRESEATVIGRLVDRYLEKCPADARDRITIATRFGCVKRAGSLCRSILNKPSESPSIIVTALLAANAIGLPETEIAQWISQYRTDHRVSHVWRSMNPPKTTHRTQVRDVAYALRLYRQGVDPRDRGFASLVADPIMVFRAYSLGFDSQEKRAKSHAGW